MNKRLIVAVAFALATATTLAGAQEEKQPTATVDAAAKAKQVCAACHGEDGNKTLTPDIPKLGGQPADYLARALHEYKSGARKQPIMGAMATSLSEQEIEGLADYFSKQKGDLYVKY